MPCITFVGGIHGLERSGTQVVLTFLETLINRLQWDQVFEDMLQRVRIIFLPLTLEMGSWRWIRKNPLQLRNSLGLFHLIKLHRINRVHRGHLILMGFLIHATLSYEKWLNESHTESMTQEAMELWYHESR